MLSNPLPLALVVLNALLPGLFLLAFLVVRRLFQEALTALYVAFGVGLAGWLLFTHLAATLSHSLSAGMTISSVTLGLLGYALWLRSRRSRRSPALLRTLEPSGLEWLFVLVSSVVVAALAWRWAWHDEISVNGHHAMVASIQNSYPPPNLSFPRYPLPYHYGFNLLCAMGTGLWRLSVTHAIDVVTIGLWGFSALGLCLLGARIVGRSYGVVFAALALLGGGFPFTCKESYASLQPLGGHLLNSCTVGGELLNPPLISYFFQHPWSLGVPLTLCALLVQAEERERRWLRLSLLALVLTVLCLAQAALFFAVTGACIASELLDERTLPWRQRLISAGCLLLVLGLMPLLLGGLWSGSPVGSLLIYHLGIVKPLTAAWQWTYLTFGVLLLGLAGWWGLERRRFLYLALGLGCAVLVNLVQYQGTWDIVKFATIGSFGLAMLLTGLLKLLGRSRFLVLRVALPGVLALLAMFSGASFALALALRLPGIPAMYAQVPPAVPEDDRQAAEYLRQVMPRGTIMYRASGYHRPYSCYAGLPQVWIENAFPINLKFLPERTKLVTEWPVDPERYRQEGIRFFVVSKHEGRVETLVNGWLKKGLAVERRRFGKLRVIELPEAPGPAAPLASAHASK